MLIRLATGLGSGGGQVVSVLAFSSDDLSSNPADVISFSIKFVFEKNKKRPGLATGICQ